MVQPWWESIFQKPIKIDKNAPAQPMMVSLTTRCPGKFVDHEQAPFPTTFDSKPPKNKMDPNTILPGRK